MSDNSTDNEFVTDLWEDLGESPDRWIGAIHIIRRLSGMVEVSEAAGFPAEMILSIMGSFLNQVTDHPIVETVLAKLSADSAE